MANILIVDDSKFLRTHLKEIIEDLSYDIVFEAEDGFDAINKYKEDKYDLVFMDINMPNLDGIAAARTILSFDNNAKIVMLTSHDENNIKYDILRDKGILDYIIKPIDLNRLSHILKVL